MLQNDGTFVLQANSGIYLGYSPTVGPDTSGTLQNTALGTSPDGLVRISPGPFNTEADIDHLIDALKQITGGM